MSEREREREREGERERERERESELSDAQFCLFVCGFGVGEELITGPTDSGSTFVGPPKFDVEVVNLSVEEHVFVNRVAPPWRSRPREDRILETRNETMTNGDVGVCVWGGVSNVVEVVFLHGGGSGGGLHGGGGGGGGVVRR